MALHSEIFKSYDIRGIYPTQFDEAGAEIVARAFAAMLHGELNGRRPTIVVGGDMRLSTPLLKERVIAGLLAVGANVVDVGLVSTPTFYFAVARYGYDGGMQVSASHNPKEYNGLKMVRSQARPLGKGTGMEQLKALCLGGDIPAFSGPGQRHLRQDILTDLVREQSARVDLKHIRPLTVVVDAANAMGSLDIEALFAHLPCKVIKLNFTLDGNFPSHQPDPLDPKNLELLAAAVQGHQADLGIAPDGDGDRYFFMDEQGQVIRQEILRGIMAQDALAGQPGATVCYDIRPGRITRDMIEAVGGQAVVTPVGHSLIKAKMLEVGAIFGGESSGHYFYQYPYGTFEAPVELTLRFLAWLGQRSGSVAAAVAPYRKYFHSGEINSRVQDVPAVLARIQQRYRDGRITLLDGVTVEYPEYWFNVRGSNTEPLIRLNLEAVSAAVMAEKRDEVLKLITS